MSVSARLISPGGPGGAVAQLEEYLNGIQGVRGSNPLSSTNSPRPPKGPPRDVPPQGTDPCDFPRNSLIRNILPALVQAASALPEPAWHGLPERPGRHDRQVEVRSLRSTGLVQDQISSTARFGKEAGNSKRAPGKRD
jgi:hypothetical protein